MPSATHLLIAATSSRCAAASSLVEGSMAGGGRACQAGGAMLRTASSSSCSSNSMAIVATPATSLASRFNKFSEIARAMFSSARFPLGVSCGRGRASCQGTSAWHARSSSWISPRHKATSC